MLALGGGFRVSAILEVAFFRKLSVFIGLISCSFPLMETLNETHLIGFYSGSYFLNVFYRCRRPLTKYWVPFIIRRDVLDIRRKCEEERKPPTIG